MMLGSDFGADLVEAAMGETFDRILHLRPRISQLKDFSLSSDEFEPLALTFKRVNNIIKKQSEMFDVDPGLFCEKPEEVLWETYQNLKTMWPPVLKNMRSRRLWNSWPDCGHRWMNCSTMWKC